MDTGDVLHPITGQRHNVVCGNHEHPEGKGGISGDKRINA